MRVNGDSSGYTWTPTYSTFTLESGNLTNGVIVLGNGATAIINGGTVSRLMDRARSPAMAPSIHPSTMVALL